MTVSKLNFKNLRIEGSSRAADRSWYRIQPPGLAFDLGRGSQRLIGTDQLFLSHGHLDHALGLPYVLSQRNLHGFGPCRLYCPRPIRRAVENFVEAAAALEEVEYRYQLRGLEAGERVELGHGWSVEPFAVDHVLPSLGYHLIQARRSLAPALRGLDGAELARRRRAGERIDHVEERIEVSYCGDTAAGVFDLEPRLFEARVLLLECTFLGSELETKARQFGHLHVADLAAQADRFANEALVLIHLSRRHRLEELRQAVEQRMPNLAPELIVFGEHSNRRQQGQGKRAS